MLSINNEAKVQRSTKSLVLGKAKVMSYKDIEEARAKRAIKEAIRGKGKRGRKRKSAMPESDLELDLESEPEPEVARAAKKVRKGEGKRARKRKSVALEADQPEPEPEPMPGSEAARRIIAPETWSVPVARMY